MAVVEGVVHSGRGYHQCWKMHASVGSGGVSVLLDGVSSDGGYWQQWSVPALLDGVSSGGERRVLGVNSAGGYWH